MSGRGIPSLDAAFALLSSTADPSDPIADSALIADILRDARLGLPGRLGNLARHEVIAGPPDMVIANYRLVRDDLIRASADIYVTREPMSVAEEIAYLERVSLGSRVDVTPIAVPAPGGMGRRWRDSVEGTPIFRGLATWERNGWRVKVRASAMAAAGGGDWQEVERLIQKFSLLEPPVHRAPSH